MAGNILGVTDFTGVRVGGGSSITGSTLSDGAPIYWVGSAASAFAALTVTGNLSSDRTIVVPGARAGDVVALGIPSGLSSGVAVHGFVTADNTVTVRFSAATTLNQSQTAQTFRAAVFRF